MALRLSSHSALCYRHAVSRRGYASARSSFGHRQFSSSRVWKDTQHEGQKDQQNSHSGGKESFSSRLRSALRNTKVEWRPIPVALGVLFLGFFQFYKMQRAESEHQVLHDVEDEENGVVPSRRRIRPSGPWQVQVMSTLPLKAISRVWGSFNELEIPYPLRVPGFKLYSWIFGANLDEIAEPDLHNFPNLAAFFYRTLKPGARPIDPDPRAIVSPSDGRVLQFGLIERGEVEQVKGMTYRLDALLGATMPTFVDPHVKFDNGEPDPTNIEAHEEFARMNGISYTLPALLSGDQKAKGKKPPTLDASTPSEKNTEVEVKKQLDLGDGRPWYAPKPASATALHYVVIYLAPGDYHRFHSPVSWVVESRRHFAGELYSVSPYLQRTLPGLFTLNERVVLLGRWRWGFFSYTPVGATNVGSIKINFDSELRTNSLTTDTAADRAAAAAARRGEQYSGFAEATYRHASRILGGYPLRRGDEMGGFQLGSTIVLVFEAPIGKRKSFDIGWTPEREGGWTWTIHQGQRVKVGEKLGYVNI